MMSLALYPLRIKWPQAWRVTDGDELNMLHLNDGIPP